MNTGNGIKIFDAVAWAVPEKQIIKFFSLLLNFFFHYFRWVRFVSEHNPALSRMLSKGLQAYKQQNWYIFVFIQIFILFGPAVAGIILEILYLANILYFYVIQTSISEIPVNYIYL